LQSQQGIVDIRLRPQYPAAPWRASLSVRRVIKSAPPPPSNQYIDNYSTAYDENSNMAIAIPTLPVSDMQPCWWKFNYNILHPEYVAEAKHLKVESISIIILLSHTLVRLVNTLLKDGESARNNHVLAYNFAKCSPILKMFSHDNSAINIS